MGTFRDDRVALSRRVEAKKRALQVRRDEMVEHAQKDAAAERALSQELGRLDEKFYLGWRSLLVMGAIVVALYAVALRKHGLDTVLTSSMVLTALLIGPFAYRGWRTSRRARGDVHVKETALPPLVRVEIDRADREQLHDALAELDRAESELDRCHRDERADRSVRVAMIEERLKRADRRG